MIEVKYYRGIEVSEDISRFNKSKYCPENCSMMNHNESGQELYRKLTGRMEPHNCLLFNKQLYHLGQHPKIHKCDECLSETTNYITICRRK